MKRRFFLFIIFGLIALIVILAMLPMIGSTETAREQAIQMINKRIPGHLNIAQWSLHWFGGIQCKDLTYEDKIKNISVQIDKISLSKGLMALVFNYRKPGQIEILNPYAVVQLPGNDKYAGVKTGPDGKFPPDKANSSGDRNLSSGELNEHSRRKVALFTLPPIVADLKITGGAIGVVYADKKEEVVLKDLMLDINIDEPGKPISYRLLARAGKDPGRISGQGSLVIPTEGIVATNPIRSDTDITITDWDMTPLLSIGSAFYGFPSGEGLLNGRFQIEGSAVSEIRLTGQLNGTDVRLTGGMLKADAPTVEKITCNIDAVQMDNEWVINHLSFDSFPARGSLKGRLDNRGKGRYQTEAVLNLAEISNQLPKTLNLKPGIKITDGLVKLKVMVESDDRTTRFDGNLHLNRLAGTSGKKRLAWNEPLTAYAAGSYGDDGMHLDSFKAHSSFLSGEGQGDLDNLQIRLNADILAALEEVNKFIDTKDWKAAGQINLNLHAGARSNKAQFVEADLEIDGLQLHRKNQVIVPTHRFTSRLKTDVKLDQKSRLAELSQTSIDFNTWLGKGRLAWKQLDWSGGKDLPKFQEVAYDGTLSLGPLSRLWHGLNVWPGDTHLAGHANIQTLLSSDMKTISFEETRINVDNFIYQKAKRRIQDKKISLYAKGQVNLKNRSANLTPLEIKTTAGNVAFPELSINNWDDIIHAVKGNGTAKMDLTALATSFGNYLNLPAKAKVAGMAEIELKTDLEATKKQTLNLNCNFNSIKVDMAKRSILAEDQISLGMDLVGDFANQNLSIKQMALIAKSVSINAAGRISPQDREHLLAADGVLAVDLERLQNPLNKLLGTDFILSGKSKRPFSVRIETENNKWQNIYKHVDLKAALYADRISGFGLELSSIDMPVNIEKTLTRINISGNANEGELELHPAIHLAGSPPLLSLPDDSTILNNTKLTKEMANELLILIHPIFKGTTAAQGTVDLVMHQLSWPLSAPDRKDARFKGILRFKDVRINAEGLIYDLLTAMKIKERDIFLEERTVEFSGQNGRIKCSPLRISVKGYQIEVGGTMGFDGSLDYIAKIPITLEMVGEKIYPYAKETSLEIPIGGTVSRPKLNRDALERMVQKMMQQTGSQVLEEKAGELLKKIFK